MRRLAAVAALAIVLAACGGTTSEPEWRGPTIETVPGSQELERVTFDKSMYPSPGDECPETALGNKSVRKNDLTVENMLTCVKRADGTFHWDE